MHDELLQFQRNDVWTLVPRPEGEHIIGTKCIFRNKTDEEGNVIHNKAHLVAQGYLQNSPNPSMSLEVQALSKGHEGCILEWAA